MRRYIPENPLQYRLWSFATSPFCEYTVFIAILLNTTSLAMKFYKQPTAYTDFLDVLNQIFTYFFLVECILKLGAFRFKVNHCLGRYRIIPFLLSLELLPRSLERLRLFHRGGFLSGPWSCLYKRKLSLASGWLFNGYC